MRAQITVFIIIGILVLVAFGITLYVGSNLNKRVASKETQQRFEQLGVQPIQDYINTCLSLATSEGLSLIGRQGGTIYQSQGGLTPDFTEGEGINYVKYTDPDLGILDVSFLILPPNGNVGTLFFSEPPQYPFPGFPYPPGETTPLFTGYYGINKLPPLYRISSQTGQKVEGSLQENLETFIAKRTADCASWKTFEDKGYSITAGTAIASLLFAEKQTQFAGEQYITVELLWPVEITTLGGDKTLLKDFAIKEQVRLATIYYTIKRIIDGDVTDISYTPKNEGAFSMTIFPYVENSFIIAKDGQSIVNNKPFEFWIPRKNRRPALWQINTDQLNDVVLHVTKEGRGTAINIIKVNDTDSQLEFNDPCEQNTPIIKLRALDPDEDPVTFSVHIPASVNNEIPNEALTFSEFSITIFAKDKSNHPEDWFDSQEIPLKVALCPES